MFTVKPIGYLHSPFLYKNGTPRQGNICQLSRGRIVIEKSMFNNPEHALEGLQEFSHVWIFFIFHKNNADCTKAKVKPPRLNGKKTGVFASRSPYRPNNIGLTLAKIESVIGAILTVSGVDIIDGSPIIDLKPYIPQYDCPSAFRHTNNIFDHLLVTSDVTLCSDACENKESNNVTSDFVSSSPHITADAEHIPATDADDFSAADAKDYSVGKGDHSKEINDLNDKFGKGNADEGNSIDKLRTFCNTDELNSSDKLVTCNADKGNSNDKLKTYNTGEGNNNDYLMTSCARLQMCLPVDGSQKSTFDRNHTLCDCYDNAENVSENSGLHKNDRALVTGTETVTVTGKVTGRVTDVHNLDNFCMDKTSQLLSIKEYHDANKLCQNDSLIVISTNDNSLPNGCVTNGNKVEHIQTSIAQWIEKSPMLNLKVRFTEASLKQLKHFGEDNENEMYKLSHLRNFNEVREAIVSILCEDPRSTYRRKQCTDSLYYFTVDSVHVTCWFDDSENLAEILRIKPLKLVLELKDQTTPRLTH